jgi:hypothetical protein
MALPRPALLAIAGAMLSMLSFTVMRTIAANGGEDFALPAPAPPAATQTAAKPDREVKPPPPPKVKDVPAPVANALADGKVAVLLFVEPGAAEDTAVAQEFRALGGVKGVAPFRANIADVGKYAGIVANLGLTQAPAIVIVRPDLKAVPPIEGYVESGYILQRVRDQLP